MKRIVSAVKEPGDFQPFRQMRLYKGTYITEKALPTPSACLLDAANSAPRTTYTLAPPQQGA
jgi:hypothetical protein